MSAGNRITLRERATGILLIPDGAPTIYTLEAGQILRVVRVIAESNLAEVEANGHRLLFSQDSLYQHGRLVFAA